MLLGFCVTTYNTKIFQMMMIALMDKPIYDLKNWDFSTC